jgi:hypothetical protein
MAVTSPRNLHAQAPSRARQDLITAVGPGRSMATVIPVGTLTMNCVGPHKLAMISNIRSFERMALIASLKHIKYKQLCREMACA